jgi:hypothetical protein
MDGTHDETQFAPKYLSERNFLGAQLKISIVLSLRRTLVLLDYVAAGKNK